MLVGATIVGSMATVWHGVVNPPRPGTVREWTYDDREIVLRQGDTDLIPTGGGHGLLVAGDRLGEAGAADGDPAVRVLGQVGEERRGGGPLPAGQPGLGEGPGADEARAGEVIEDRVVDLTPLTGRPVSWSSLDATIASLGDMQRFIDDAQMFAQVSGDK